MKIKVEVEVSKETYEMGMGAGKIIGVVKEALKDGWQPGADLPPILTTTVGELGKNG